MKMNELCGHAGAPATSMAAAALAGLFCSAQPAVAETFLDVGSHPPITIMVNSSPWYAGFEAVVDLYQEQTGNQVELDVTPYGGMLEKARLAVRGGESPFDLINIDTQWTIEFYEGGFLRPIDEIDPEFVQPPEVVACGYSNYWNAEKRWRTPDGGRLMAIVPNCNTHVLFYRKDLFDEAGLAAPETYEDVAAACAELADGESLYGFVTRGERGNAIRFDWMPFMLAYEASVVADPENGDYTVTVNSPQALAALDLYITLMRDCGPPNYGTIGQADMIQLMATGKMLTVQSVIAAWANFEDPTKSAIVGKAAVAVPPSVADGIHGVAIGNWNLGVPKNLPEERQKAAVAFLKWFLTEGAQRYYVEEGAMPVRSDVLESDLGQTEKFRWMAAYNDALKVAQQVLGYAEGAEVEQVLGLRLNQALIGEMSSAEALNAAAEDIHAIFTRTGRDTGLLEPLPE